MNCNDIVCYGCKLFKECYIQVVRFFFDIFDLMYDLFIIGKGFFSDVNLVIWKIMWYFRLFCFML